MSKRRVGILAAALIAVAVSLLPLAPQQAQAILQVSNTIELNTVPAYLGPEVVVSGSVSSSVGIPSVSVTIEDVVAGDAVVFTGPASTALRPPLGDPAASWRVPLTLADGRYRVIAVSELNGETLGQASAEFDVVSDAIAPATLVPLGAIWGYFDEGTQPAPTGAVPVNWYEIGYDDSLWPTGPAELGYGDGDEATVTAATGDFGQSIVTQYFRHEFVPGDLGEYDTITMSLLRDDGAVVYLNGVELGRTNMPDGVITYNTLASTVSEQTISIPVDPATLLDGPNLLAVEVHQSSFNSTDISFSAAVEATQSDTPRVSNNTEGTFVLAAGDMARCNFDGDEAVAAQMAELFDTDAGAFIGLGDLVYNSGTIDEFTACYDPTIGQFRDVTWPSPGNHEHYTSPNAAGYRQYFGPAAGPTAGPNGGLWYSFDIDEHWHVIALDSDCNGREVLPGAVSGDGCAVGSVQEQWLRADLEANQDKNILAFFHHPPFTNNQYTDHQYTWPLWRALSEYGAEITLHGHEHHYERYVPLDYWGVPGVDSGVTEFIIGSGGTYPRYDIRAQESESAFRGTFPQGTNDFGVLQLWLRPDGFEWKWESIYGLAASDSGVAGLNDPMERAAITGIVSDAATAQALSGIEVCATADRSQVRTCTTTEADGSYEFGPLVADSYDLETDDPSLTYDSADSVTVVLAPPSDQVQPLQMLPRPAISGIVSQSPFGQPIPNAQVCATPTAGGAPQCSNTATDGTYVLPDLAALTNYIVEFSAPDFLDAETTVDLDVFDVDGVNAALLVGPGSISGTVTAADTGFSLEGIQVCADSLQLPQPTCTETAADGTYTLEGLLTGNYTVSYDDPSMFYESECYRNRSCDSPIVVGVIQPGARVGIDATLDPAPVSAGDADCNGRWNVADALIIAQFSVGSRVEVPCPRTNPVTQIAQGSGDANSDGRVNVADTLIVAQCAVGVTNVLCPGG